MSRSSSVKLAQRLAHDVGKYVARTARNLEGHELDSTLRAMLVADLYAIDGQRTARALFDELCWGLDDPWPRALLRCRQLLELIDERRGQVERGEESEVRETARFALEVHDLLRGHLLETRRQEAQP